MKCSIFPIKNVCVGIYDGPHATPPVSNSGGIYLGISNITKDGHLDFSDIKYIGEDYLPQWTKRVTPQEGDIVFSYEATLNLYAIIPKNFYGSLGRRMAVIRPDTSKVNTKYLFYYFFSKKWRDLISERTITGSTVDRIPIATFPEFPVELPDLPTQTRIATILSRYDSLIENYQKQIKLLEEAAQRLYKEWFVDLRFPGHEKVKVVDGVPEGWERKRAIDFFTISIGKTPPRAEKQWFTDGTDGIPWVSISDMKDVSFVISTSEGLTKEACEKHNIKIVSKGSVLLSFKLTVGRVAIANTDLCTNEAIAHFIKDGENWREYTFLCLRNYNYDSLGNTSGISKAVNSTIVKNMPFLMPTDIVLDKFSSKLVPMFNTIKNLQSQIRNLTESRDRMLVKLMSGEIEV